MMVSCSAMNQRTGSRQCHLPRKKRRAGAEAAPTSTSITKVCQSRNPFPPTRLLLNNQNQNTMLQRILTLLTSTCPSSATSKPALRQDAIIARQQAMLTVEMDDATYERASLNSKRRSTRRTPRPARFSRQRSAVRMNDKPARCAFRRSGLQRDGALWRQGARRAPAEAPRRPNASGPGRAAVVDPAPAANAPAGKTPAELWSFRRAGLAFAGRAGITPGRGFEKRTSAARMHFSWAQHPVAINQSRPFPARSVKRG